MLRYVHPDTFAMFEREAYAMGFRHAAVGALVRSSYHADQQAEDVLRRRPELRCRPDGAYDRRAPAALRLARRQLALTNAARPPWDDAAEVRISHGLRLAGTMPLNNDDRFA